MHIPIRIFEGGSYIKRNPFQDCFPDILAAQLQLQQLKTLPPNKLRGSGFSTPYTHWCLICTISSELKCISDLPIWVSRCCSPLLFSWRVRHPLDSTQLFVRLDVNIRKETNQSLCCKMAIGHGSKRHHWKSTKSAQSISSMQASKLQKRDFRDFFDAKVCSSNRNIKFENFMRTEWREEKFLKGSVGDKSGLRFWSSTKR